MPFDGGKITLLEGFSKLVDADVGNSRQVGTPPISADAIQAPAVFENIANLQDEPIR